MEKRQFYFIIIILLCSVSHSHAQWEKPFRHYWGVKGYYNPSFAGETDNIRSAAIYHLQQAGLNNATFENSPQRLTITADMPFQFLQRKHGLGIVAFTENIGSLRNSLLAAQYSFKHQLGGGMLNIGLQAGIYNLNYDAGSINLHQRLNISITDKQIADLNTGISWIGNRFHTGLSVMHLNQPGFDVIPGSDLDSDSIRSYITRTYNFIAGYNIDIINSLEIQPMIWVLHNKNQTQTQATLRLEYDKRFSGGFTLISESGYSFFAGANIQGFRLGYAYTAHNREIEKGTKGDHELFIGYDLSLDSFNPKLQPHKSIRLL